MKIFKLNIPTVLKSDRTDEDGNVIEPVEYFSQGNHETVVERGGTTETNSERYADWLVREHGFELAEVVEVEPETIVPEIEESEEQTADYSDQYPEDYPGRKALIEAQIPRATVKNLTGEQLVQVKGIGDKTADEILSYEAENNGGQE